MVCTNIVLVLITGALAIAAFKQWRATAKAARAAADSASAAKKAILLTHRPRLRVRRVIVNELSNDHPDSLSGFVRVANIGDTSATITRAVAFFSFQPNGALTPTDEVWQRLSTLAVGNAVELKPGDRTDIEIERLDFSDGRWLGWISTAGYGPRAKTESIFLIGRLQYSDELGNQREVGWCRKFEGMAGNGLFLPVNDAEWEYED